MTGTVFDIDAYLGRVGLAAPPARNADGLVRLHRAHAFAIPFETVDVVLGRPPSLAPAALQDKMVARRRGGYCYEMNGLLALALAALGFAAVSRLARVLFNRPAPGPRSHQFLLVDLGGRRWLADVGFGGPGLVAPMPFEPGRIETQHGARFRLQPDPDLGLVLQRGRDDGWVGLYGFAEESCLPVDVDMANHFTATAAQSPFRRSLVCVRPTAEGRVTLRGSRLSLFAEEGNGESRPVGGAADLGAALAAHFDLVLPPADLERLAAGLEPDPIQSTRSDR